MTRHKLSYHLHDSSTECSRLASCLWCVAGLDGCQLKHNMFVMDSRSVWLTEPVRTVHADQVLSYVLGSLPGLMGARTSNICDCVYECINGSEILNKYIFR